MMNMIQLQEQLKDFSQDQLINEMRMPSGNVPQYLVLSEMQRRKRMEAAAAGDQGRPQTTVAEDAVAAAGVPQGGIAQMARSLAPQTDMTQNTGQGQSPVTGMSGGGTVRRMENGGLAGISRDLGVYRPTLGASPSMHRGSGMLYSEMAPEELSILANGGDAQAEMELMARSGGAGSAEPIARPEPERERMTIEEAAQGEFAAMEDGVPAGGTGEGYYPTWQDVENIATGATVGVVAPGLIPGMVTSGGPRDLAYDIGEGVGFGPAMEAAGIEDPAIARQRARDEREAQAERQRIAEEGALPMTTGDTLQVAPGESLLPPSAAQAPTSDETGGAGGAGGASDADRLAEQDRWLALARFGLGLMSSRSPTFGGAIGEAGMDALDYMQGMEQQRFERDLAERTLAARSAGSGQEGMRPPTGGDLLDRMAEIDESLQSLSMNVIGGETDAFTAEAIARLTAERAQIAATLGFGAPGSGGPAYDVSD